MTQVVSKAQTKLLKLPEPTLNQLEAQFTNAKEATDAKRQVWKRMHEKLNLEYDIPGFEPDELVKLSRFYPMVRNIVAGIAFHHPRIFVNAKPLVENSEKDLSMVSRIIERVLNQALTMMGTKEEVQQAIYDMLLCGVGWLKQSYNPPGLDAEPPYTLNDRFQDDFPMVQRLDPRLVHVSPLCAPHTIATCPIIFEEIYVPIDFLLADDRIDKKALAELKPMSESQLDEAESQLGSDLSPDVESSLAAARAQGKVVRVVEAHNRAHRRFAMWADGVKIFLRNEIHPFVDADVGQDPQTGEVQIVPKPGFILKNGYQYIPLRIDSDLESFHPTPPLAYIEDLQDMQVESASRRLDQMKRFSRLLGLLSSEEQARPGTKQAIEDGRDGTVLLLEDLNSLTDFNFAVGSPGQQQLEQDAKVFEAETLDIGDLALAKGASRKTATEVSLSASRGTLTREWMQTKISDVYAIIAENVLNMFKDIRYLPETLIVNTAGDDQQAVHALLTTDDFQHIFELDIDAQSMQPLVAERDMEHTMQLYDRFVGNPMIDQSELTKLAIKASGVRSWERLFKGRGKAEAEAHAWKENTGFLIKGVDPGVTEGEDHKVHLQVHSMENMQKIPEFRGIDPQIMQQVGQALQQHMEAHQEAFEKAVNPQTGGGQVQGISGRLAEPAKDIPGQVASAAQGFAEAASNQGQALDGS